ncbi:MAG: sugar phosphate isomerase/epimerase family protein [Tepidisphaerales bacterium]
MKLSICSYSFHRLLAEGKQDIFRYITDCRDLGCTQLDPWMAHFEPIQAACSEWRKVPFPHQQASYLSSEEVRYLAEVRRAAERAGLPFGCIAVDGGHMYEKDVAARNANRAIAYRWIDVCAVLGARQIRLDSGGTHAMPDAEFKVIVEGFCDVVARAAARGVEVVIENHWGASQVPDNLLRILGAVPGLKMLWDSYNFVPELKREGREKCAPYAAITHMKTFRFDDAGNEPDEDIPHAVRTLKAAGYDGTWGIESCPKEMDEYEAARKTIALLKKLV